MQGLGDAQGLGIQVSMVGDEGPFALGHVLIVREHGGGGANLGAHVADGRHAGCRDGVEPLAIVPAVADMLSREGLRKMSRAQTKE